VHDRLVHPATPNRFRTVISGIVGGNGQYMFDLLFTKSGWAAGDPREENILLITGKMVRLCELPEGVGNGLRLHALASTSTTAGRLPRRHRSANLIRKIPWPAYQQVQA